GSSTAGAPEGGFWPSANISRMSFPLCSVSDKGLGLPRLPPPPPVLPPPPPLPPSADLAASPEGVGSGGVAFTSAPFGPAGFTSAAGGAVSAAVDFTSGVVTSGALTSGVVTSGGLAVTLGPSPFLAGGIS